jgi:hypothetical protein
MAARIAMIAMTTSNSISVNARPPAFRDPQDRHRAHLIVRPVTFALTIIGAIFFPFQKRGNGEDALRALRSCAHLRLPDQVNRSVRTRRSRLSTGGCG